MDISLDKGDVSKLQRILSTYAITANKDLQDVIAKKGDDIRWNLYGEYRRIKGKDGRGGKVFWQDLKRRSQVNRGTWVRTTELLAKYAASAPTVDKRGRNLSRWQRLVYQEITRRTRGIGLLSLAFLARRGKMEGGKRSYTRNVSSTLGTLGTIESQPLKDGQEVEILGFTPGLRKIANKYGILQRAIDAVTADTEVYLSRKLGDNWRKRI